MGLARLEPEVWDWSARFLAEIKRLTGRPGLLDTRRAYWTAMTYQDFPKLLASVISGPGLTNFNLLTGVRGRILRERRQAGRQRGSPGRSQGNVRPCGGGIGQDRNLPRVLLKIA